MRKEASKSGGKNECKNIAEARVNRRSLRQNVKVMISNYAVTDRVKDIKVLLNQSMYNGSIFWNMVLSKHFERLKEQNAM